MRRRRPTGNRGPGRLRPRVVSSSYRAALAAVLTAVTLILAACGSGGDPGTSPGGGVPTDRPTDGPAPAEVRSVTVTQSGGVAGVLRTWRVGPGTPGSDEVFAAATREALAGTDPGIPREPPCCDLFAYEVLVRYADGGTARYVTYTRADENLAPGERQLHRLVAAAMRTDIPTPDKSRG